MTTLNVADGYVLRPDLRVERSDVLIDRDRGEVVEIGPDLAGGETLDASESLVMPGLVNAHTHAAMTLFRGYADDKPLDAWLREDIWPAEAELTPEDIEAGTRLAAVEMIRSGTTAFADMYFAEPTVADVVEESGLRARLGHGIVTVGKDEEAARADLEEGIEVAADLRERDRVRSAFMPHSLTTVDLDLLGEYVERARDLGVPVHYHANETTEEVDPLVEAHDQRPLEIADERGLLEPGDFVAHGVHLDRTEIDLLADRDVAVVHCPASNMKLASGMAPVQEMLDAGVTVAVGTDGAASNNDLDVFDELRDAAMIGKLAADDASAVPAEAVVRAATQGGSEALSLPGGRIEVGAAADLTVLDLAAAHLTPAHDLVSHLAYAVRGGDVRHTVCDGQVLMRDREIQTIDAAAARREATDHAEAVVGRAESS